MIEILIDSFGRNLYYLRFSVTDRCQLACSYCRAKTDSFLPEKSVLTFDEVVKLGAIFKSLGTKKVRITGGEPLFRNDSVEIIKSLHLLGLNVALTTNGVRLKNVIESIKDTVNSINVSLDTLNPKTFEKITGMDGIFLKSIIDSIILAKKSDLNVKINTVILKENEDEAIDLIKFASDLKIPIRFIEYMSNGKHDTSSNIDSLKEIIENSIGLVPIKEKFGDGPARYFRSHDDGVIGFISYSKEHFCDSCNRLRITSDGKLRLCLILGIEMDLMKMMRSGLSDDEIKNSIIEFVKFKPFSHGKVELIEKGMNRIGG